MGVLLFIGLLGLVEVAIDALRIDLEKFDGFEKVDSSMASSVANTNLAAYGALSMESDAVDHASK